MNILTSNNLMTKLIYQDDESGIVILVNTGGKGASYTTSISTGDMKSVNVTTKGSIRAFDCNADYIGDYPVGVHLDKTPERYEHLDNTRVTGIGTEEINEFLCVLDPRQPKIVSWEAKVHTLSSMDKISILDPENKYIVLISNSAEIDGEIFDEYSTYRPKVGTFIKALKGDVVVLEIFRRNNAS